MLTAIWDFLFHRHDWKLIESGDLYNGDRLFGHYEIHRCKKCYKIKQQELTL